ncbi:hypothetical protein ABZP36_024363 [Zizania latifolia]
MVLMQLHHRSSKKVVKVDTLEQDVDSIKTEFLMLQAVLIDVVEKRSQMTASRSLSTWFQLLSGLAHDVEDCLMAFYLHLEKPSRAASSKQLLLSRPEIAERMRRLVDKIKQVNTSSEHYKNAISSAVPQSQSQSLAHRSSPHPSMLPLPPPYRPFLLSNTPLLSSPDPRTLSALALAVVMQRTLRANKTIYEKHYVQAKKLSELPPQLLHLRHHVAWWCRDSGYYDVGLPLPMVDTRPMGGVYESQDISSLFEQRAWVTISHPFNLHDILASLAQEIDAQSFSVLGNDTQSNFEALGARIKDSSRRCLIVLDDVLCIDGT